MGLLRSAADVADYYRAISEPEHEDFLQCKRLRAGPNTMGDGKHLWGTLEAARRYARMLREFGWEPPAAYIVRVRLPGVVAEGVEFLGPNLDRAGPGYFASFEALDSAEIIVEEAVS
jgi:hypothetical protein